MGSATKATRSILQPITVARPTGRVGKALAWLVLSQLVFSCVTTTKRRPAGGRPLAEKVGDHPTETRQTSSAGSAGAKSVAPPPPSSDELLAFVRGQTRLDAAFGEREHRFVADLPRSPVSGSIAEAAQVIGTAKAIINPLHLDATSFKESDLGLPAPPATPEPTLKARISSLEESCRERGVNLPDALAENPLLSGPQVARVIAQALDSGANSDEFRAEVLAALRRYATQWGELASTLGVQAAVASPASEAPPPAPAAETDDLPPNPADIAGGDAVLTEAQALADRGDFQGAIRKAASLPDGPLRNVATERVRDYSNRAVQDLRRKAALAFQSAMPLTEARKRAEYLRQAKGYLEEAIKNYPEATQLPTVKDNLRVISRDLDNLEREMAIRGH